MNAWFSAVAVTHCVWSETSAPASAVPDVSAITSRAVTLEPVRKEPLRHHAFSLIGSGTLRQHRVELPRAPTSQLEPAPAPFESLIAEKPPPPFPNGVRNTTLGEGIKQAGPDPVPSPSEFPPSPTGIPSPTLKNHFIFGHQGEKEVPIRIVTSSGQAVPSGIGNAKVHRRRAVSCNSAGTPTPGDATQTRYAAYQLLPAQRVGA